jgi:hypothetical protein
VAAGLLSATRRAQLSGACSAFASGAKGHKISPERLEEFRRLYNEAYGEEITQEEAVEMTHRLLTIYKLVFQPLPEAGGPHPASPSLPARRPSEYS